jgi:ParB/Sulfiredoxin domain
VLQEILAKPNKEYKVPLSELLTWYPGDFICPCGRITEYHDCVNIDKQWIDVLEICRSDERYDKIYWSIKQHGFVVPICAQVTQSNQVMVVDGHHRVGVAWDLALDEIPVYVADSSTDRFDLKAMDSGWWTNQKPWVTILRD